MPGTIRKTIEHYGMLGTGDKIVLGVSGGADSIALLYALHELRDHDLELIVAHLNHGLRGDEAERDARFVEQVAQSLNLPFEYKEVNTLQFKEERQLSIEEAGRILRYEFFTDVFTKFTADKIATAHTLDDQAETVLMRLFRGSGLRGLSGIPPVSGNIIRPLIETRRSEIEDFLNSSGIKWVEDSTNKEAVFLRNKIRLDLLPELKNYNPQIHTTLARTADILRIDQDFIKISGMKEYKKICSPMGSEIISDLGKYKKLHQAIRFFILRHSLETVKQNINGISLRHITAADEFLLSESTSGEIEFPGEITIAKGYDYFLVTSKFEISKKFSYQIPSAGYWDFPEFQVQIDRANTDTLEEEDEYTAYFDIDSTQFPIEVRSFKPGDKFIPLGMGNYKKVKNLFVDCKIPVFLRTRIPIFLTKGEIFWIGGLRMDNRNKVLDKNAEGLRMKLRTPFSDKGLFA